MTLLLLFQPARAEEEIIIVVEPPTIIDPIPLELVRVVSGQPMDVGATTADLKRR